MMITILTGDAGQVKMKTALILIDFQIDYFPGGKWELLGIDAAALNAQKLLVAFRKSGAPIFYVQHIAKEPAPFFVAGTIGVEIHQSVQPQENEKVIQKEFPNSFRETTLFSDLHYIGVERVVICGAMSHMCVEATTRAAADFGFQCVVVHDACATRALEFYGYIVPAKDVHCTSMAALAFGYAQIMSTSEAVTLIESTVTLSSGI